MVLINDALLVLVGYARDGKDGYSISCGDRFIKIVSQGTRIGSNPKRLTQPDGPQILLSYFLTASRMYVSAPCVVAS